MLRCKHVQYIEGMKQEQQKLLFPVRVHLRRITQPSQLLDPQQ